jgi:hypothetical protein
MRMATTSVVEISVPLMLVLGGMSSVVLATLWLTTRLASIERATEHACQWQASAGR